MFVYILGIEAHLIPGAEVRLDIVAKQLRLNWVPDGSQVKLVLMSRNFRPPPCNTTQMNE